MVRAVGERKAADRLKAGPRDELKSYLDSPLETTVKDVVTWWGVHMSFIPWKILSADSSDMLQKHSTQYPVLARMAQDYLPIQGSSTPSERAFSNASLTDTKQRNRLAPDTFEALQNLKSAYRNGHLSAAVEAKKYYDTVTSVMAGQDSG
jgi:hypothetical protein